MAMQRREFCKLVGISAVVKAVGAVGAAESSNPYVPEADSLVLRKLDEWQDWKFGFMMHWGPYSQWGVVESWSICSEDWIRRPAGISYVDYKKKYEALPTTFNPIGFDPDVWAGVAKNAGTKYVVFTTKHHDGFSMFDTRQTDYRITAPDVPFHTNPRANIANEVFAAFRKQSFGIGAYFSKPDWHNPDYWAPEWATPDRNVNYDTRKYVERWQHFAAFVHRQIGELTSEYGSLDILWLDGGWVNSKTHPDAIVGSGEVPWPQDIDMPGLAALARRNQPGLIIVDRAVGGPYENYRTPEQQIPKTPLAYPWETCMTLGNSWSYKPNDHYKSARQIVHILVDIVAKGGNYLLNVGPDANGELPTAAVARLAEIGAWIKINGEAIYATRPVAPYRDGKLCFTRGKDGTFYAIYLLDEGEIAPGTLRLKGIVPARAATIHLLGSETQLKWKSDGAGTSIALPETLCRQTVDDYAVSLRISAIRH
ncbi:alpha-L-fucosidase [Edaphobacter acidisoli]|uniref:alpha-L-fucosidase n=2 Tax=Edaphobacter acidisoli TaxID=2040573 RepID=A0A916RHW6_9BACT|nr:alpha-L-fucosidase [Edaphobacter acidisoli]GGA56547.1 alpha-L-fucosidase [Edaphobacter acidisoli]